MTFTKLSPKQKSIFKWCYNSGYKAIICDGAVRSGKTICMITSFVLWAMKNFTGATFGICGKTVRSAERNIITPLQQIADLTHYFKITYTRSVNLLTVEGAGHKNFFYVFGGKDESSYMLIQGITLSGVLFDEVALMPRSFVEQAITRTLSVEQAKLWFNCNPDNQFHWFYIEWIRKSEEKNALHLHFLMSDNPILTEEQLDFAEKQFTGVFHDRYIKGLWVSAEGVIYDMFSMENHVLSEIPEIENGNARYVSVDYGTLNPTAFLLWEKAKDGRWICTNEYYYDGRAKGVQKTDEEYADDLLDFIGKKKIRLVIVDPSAASFIACLKRRKLCVGKADNEVLEGIRYTGSLLRNREIAFMDCCKNTIAEFTAYVWDEKAAKHGEDKPIKEHDHAMDAVRYFCNTILNKKNSWLY